MLLQKFIYILKPSIFRGYKTETILCISGGVDSTIAWFYLGKPKTVYFDLGTKYTQKEITCLNNLKKVIPDFDFIVDTSLHSFGLLETGPNAFIPYRNLLFATVCAAKYGDKIIIGGIKGDNVCDKSPKAFREMTKCLTDVGEKPIAVRSPFWKMTKPDVIKWFIENEPNAINILKTSVSCYSDTTGSCGICPSCLRKWFALKYVGIKCDNWFENNPRTSPEIPGYIKRMRQGAYDLDRTKEMFEFLKIEGLISKKEAETIERNNRRRSNLHNHMSTSIYTKG